MRFRNSFPRGMARGKRRASIKARTEMTTKRYTYSLTKNQVLAIAESMNQVNAANRKRADDMTRPELVSSQAIIRERANADMHLVQALIDGLKAPAQHVYGTQPTNLHSPS